MSKRSKEQGMTSTTIIIIVVVILILGGIWYWTKVKTPAALPANNSAAAVNATSDESIANSLNSVDTSVQADVKAMTDATKGQ